MGQLARTKISKVMQRNKDNIRQAATTIYMNASDFSRRMILPNFFSFASQLFAAKLQGVQPQIGYSHLEVQSQST
jgi:hypothetical protein